MRIVFATDGSRGAAVAEDFLLSLPLSGADEVIIASAVGASERDTYALLSRCRWRFAGRDIPASTALRNGHAADVAQALAVEHAADLIVIGSRGLGQLASTLMGSVARALTRDGVTSVLVVRARRDAPRRVLLAIDGSAEARSAVDLLSGLPLPSIAGVSLLRTPAHDDDRRRADLMAERARLLLHDRISGEDFVEGGHVGEAVARTALDGDADLIVLGAGGQAVAGRLGTSIADHVVTHAHCAVLVAKPPLGIVRDGVAANPVALSAT